MIYAHLCDLIQESDLSPEQMGDLLGISGMTVRRWLKKPKKAVLPEVYAPAIREACYKLIAQGTVVFSSPSVQRVLQDQTSHQYGAALKHLGLSEQPNSGDSDGQWLLGLSQIGSQQEKQKEVDRNEGKVTAFKRLGAEWSSRISYLSDVIRSKKLGKLDKLVAYGALFYLLTPLDFIPDHIPIFGLLDDFCVLGIAVSYYSQRFSKAL